MASINIEKIKSKHGIQSIIQHNKREHARYSNEDIDLSKTRLNTTMEQKTADECYQYFKDRLNELDNTTNTNFRKDRVEAIGIEFTIPNEVDSSKFEEFAYRYLCDKYGKENIISADCHRDEVHDYIDNGEVKESLEHIHAVVIPVDNSGKLNAKKVMGNKYEMKQMQKDFDELVFKEFGIKYQKGTVPKKKTVEELKRSSEVELSERKGFLGKVLVKKDEYNQLVNKANLYQQAIDEKNRLESSYTKIETQYKVTRKNAEKIINMKDEIKQREDTIKNNDIIIKQQEEEKYNNQNVLDRQHKEIDNNERTIAWQNDVINGNEKTVQGELESVNAVNFVRELMQNLRAKTIDEIKQKLGLKSRAKNEVSLDERYDR